MPSELSALATASVLIPTTLLSAAIVVPFSGTLVRYRANYNPKNVQLDEETQESRTDNSLGPEVKGYFSMLRRIYKLEGWAGLYKGFMPAYLTSLLYIAFALIINLSMPLRLSPNPVDMYVPYYGVLAISIFTFIIGIPASVITNRAICTPYVLSSFSPKLALSVLLSPTERRRPWKLYLTPGLIFANILLVVVGVVFIGIVAAFVGWKAVHFDNRLLKGLMIALFAITIIFASLLSAPLQVMVIRLTLQRNHGPVTLPDGEDDVVDEEPRTEAEQAHKLNLKEYCVDAEVIGLRDEFDPYTSLYDCFSRIKKEEGLKVFYRAYWITLLSQLGGAGWSVPSL